MNFDYEKIRRQQDDGGSHWASYSDLFMALSFLFLLLYVVASFRTGTVSHSAKLKQIDLVEDQRRLQEQIRVYERISKNYVDEEATKAEKQLYDDVISQLDLLGDKSTEKQRELKKQLAEEMQKTEKLNRYQETIKNLITANMNSTKDVKVREKKLSQRVKELNELEFALRKKQRELNVTGEELDKTVSKLRETSRREQQTRIAAAQKEKELKTQIESITEESKQKLEQARQELESRQMALQEKTQQLEDAKGTIAEQAQRNQQLIKQVETAQAQSQAKIQQLEQAHQSLLEEEKKKYQETLKKTQLTAQEKLQAEREYRAKVEAEAQKFNSKLSGLKDELQQRDQKMTELRDKQRSLASQNANLSKSLASAKNEQGKLKEALQERQAEAVEMAKALKAAEAKANRRKEVAKKIAESFRNSGLDVSVNPDNGDLILNFGQEYFDTGKYFIKSGMTEVLNQAVPIYAKSLFEDTSISKFINSVEIVGFASPTYKNRVVDPNSLDPRDRTAINYNLDLSYKRARAIFKHIFNTNRMNFDYQQRLLPLVKVTGRSFFTQEIQGGVDSNMDMKSFCKKYDCKKSQNVIIRFNLKD
ncbi:hypothetical protein [Pseudobacteriovorax antillogorgiicola]|uniref:Microtubule-binding protein n=1 Tax=Pseudobacteriovorax antillogorgiicola TaxID=1513793 RepID=A0A1Y6BYV3_9BACT|nr:hypothetical protein [Pseudobacteriovorax antillogorgiicola]TCS51250.1 hypothetical protein EDD56_111135 [Pseudobacteriovorax antillogorgiicola]SMF36510.1 hypothetical protein SAMN06296036_11143 [Pseudobacteriovorax antillogorgiicola]